MKKQQQSAPPPWLGTMLVAIRVMTVLIILGLLLLGYGIWDRFFADNNNAGTTTAGVATATTAPAPATRFTFPETMRFYQIAATHDGGMIIVLEDEAGNFTAVTLDAGGHEIRRLAIERQ